MSYPPPSGPPPPTSSSAPSNSNSPRSPSDREESPAAHFVPDRRRQPYTTVSSTAHGIPEDAGMASADQGERSVPEREMWFCHECHRSSQPLMQPDPHCAYCGGTFMERMDDPSNDPRDFDPDPPEEDGGPQFATPPPFFFQGGRGGQEGGGDFGQGIFGSLFRLLTGPRPSAEEGSTGQPGWQTNESTRNFGPFGLRTTTTTFRNPNRPGEGLQATFYFGNSGNAAGSPPQTTVDRGPTPTPPPQGYSPPDGPPPQPGQAQQVPIQNLAQFLEEAFGASDNRSDGSRDTGDERPLPGGIPGDHPLASLFQLFQMMGMQPLGGNSGDYVFSQQGLDDVIQRLMEQAQGHQGPPPASEDQIKNLPKFQMTQDLIDQASIKDCAVCKDEFQVDEDASKLPCRHIFHTGCINPWLEIHGTCPVCRATVTADEPKTPNPVSPQGSTSNLPAPTPIPSTARSPEIEDGSSLPQGFEFFPSQSPNPAGGGIGRRGSVGTVASSGRRNTSRNTGEDIRGDAIPEMEDID